MPSDELRVTAVHLQELAAAHSRAAAEMTAAVDLVSGVDGLLRISHGSVATPSADMIARIEETRRFAGQRLAYESRALNDSLDAVARAYVATESVSGIQLDKFLR